MRNKTSRECIRFLKESKDYYVQRYYQGGELFDDDGNMRGGISEKVINNLIRNRDIVGGRYDSFLQSYFFWLNEEKHELIY